ncbi:uncharacterized protein CDV56_104511 [Aspergillus thermomutatus]|uniref:Extracellular membrane protein CFEM domain-containing protein n=1 Tax=Aspergillus thermomutatus TaxID=41047 RepID=A0A397HK12_ASPTH|nr:uncharacterized protein CDV56_104511 [Aspergillus thermomutatus]RHZ63425.1 hypothetical protein CDV56_104511 [Aspergillus thermomutatus]
MMTAKRPSTLNARLLILLCGILFINAAGATTATLTESPAYASQQPCAKSCFYWGASSNGGADFLADRIGCAVDPIENECICRSDLQQSADSFLLKCVRENCDANALDVSSAGDVRRADEQDDFIGTRIAPATVTVTVVQTVLSSGGGRLRPAVLGQAARLGKILL